MRPLDLVILIFATYYAAVTLAKLHGPLGLAERLRHAIYRWRGFERRTISGEAMWQRTRAEAEKLSIEDASDDWLAAGVSCPLCLSLYAGTVLALAWYAGGAPGQAVVMVLAVAGGASALFSVGRYW